MIISKIVNKITSVPGYLLGKTANTGFIQYQTKANTISPATVATITTLASVVTKDLVGCYYYVTQSLKNEKIPEDKRKFVASLDLANGILNVVLQLTLGGLFGLKVGEYFNNNLAKKFFSDKTAREKVDKILDHNKEIIKNIKNIKNIKDIKDINNLTKEEKGKLKGLKKLPNVKGLTMSNIEENGDLIGKYAEKYAKKLLTKQKAVEAGFTGIVTLIITQIIAKRIFVPLIATPMASTIKAQMEKKESANPKAKASASPSPSPQVAVTKTAAGVKGADKTPECFKNFR